MPCLKPEIVVKYLKFPKLVKIKGSESFTEVARLAPKFSCQTFPAKEVKQVHLVGSQIGPEILIQKQSINH